MKETLNLSHGYTATIATDECAENPWTAWDCEPPIMVFNERRIEDYKTGLSLRDLYWMLPLSAFDGGAAAVLAALDLTPEDIDHTLPWGADVAELDAGGWREHIGECLPEDPTGWRDAIEYFDMCGALCTLAGIPWHQGQSNGYCQGHSARVFLAATPEWIKTTGVAPENAEAALEGSFKTWGAWAWGDVYGIAEITRPDGTECEGGSVWGFYGSDHTASGLLESAENTVECDRAFLAREEAEAFRAACSDIVTV
jgi:hypothetical protein